jgi:hypothetical protein
MNFEKGKWYKIRNGPNFLNIIKCSKNSYNSTEVNSSQYINLLNIKGNPPSYDRTSGSWGDIYESEEMNVNSEEIQKYLPDNHPDKTFILPENWYVIVTKENQDIIIKWADKDDIPIGNICGMCLTHDTNRITIEHNPIDIIKTDSYDFGNEISFEQFKKYVLKEENCIINDNNNVGLYKLFEKLNIK